jgi:RimJ/RimL family protein N-acetyltransferase
MSVEIPVLETERLRLRGHRIEDFPACAAMWTDPIVVRHTTGKPLTPEEIWVRLLRYIGHWALLGFGFWAVEEKATGQFAGELGFCDFKRGLGPSLDDVPEAGWVLTSQSHGKGFATEAVGAVIAWSDQHFGKLRTVCLIHPDNLASIRVAQKFSYKEYARTMYKEHEVIMLERLP